MLCCRFIDLDDVIVERAGRSIPEIFAQDGEKVFRQMELEALQYVIENSMPEYSRGPLPLRGGAEMPLPYNRETVKESDHDNIYRTPSEERSQDVVVALGGGAVMTKECAEIVKERTVCIYLKASIETLLEHLEGQTGNRPLLHSHNCHSVREHNCHPDREHNCHSDREKRVEESTTRNRIVELMGLRAETYEKTAHVVIDTDGKSIEAIASEIISIL